MIKIILESGREVIVDSFKFESTYGTFGFSATRVAEMNVKVNRRIFYDISCPLDWGKRKVFKIKPDKVDFETKLKPIVYYVQLSSKPINQKYHGSSLIVLWLGDVPNGRTMEGIIESGIKCIDWNSNAKDFFY